MLVTLSSFGTCCPQNHSQHRHNHHHRHYHILFGASLFFWQKLILEPNLGKLLIKDNMNFLTYDDRSDIKVMMSTPDCPPI